MSESKKNESQISRREFVGTASKAAVAASIPSDRVGARCLLSV